MMFEDLQACLVMAVALPRQSSVRIQQARYGLQTGMKCICVALFDISKGNSQDEITDPAQCCNATDVSTVRALRKMLQG